MFFNLWDKQGVIGKKEMKQIEMRIEEMDVPTDMQLWLLHCRAVEELDIDLLNVCS